VLIGRCEAACTASRYPVRGAHCQSDETQAGLKLARARFCKFRLSLVWSIAYLGHVALVYLHADIMIYTQILTITEYWLGNSDPAPFYERRKISTSSTPSASSTFPPILATAAPYPQPFNAHVSYPGSMGGVERDIPNGRSRIFESRSPLWNNPNYHADINHPIAVNTDAVLVAPHTALQLFRPDSSLAAAASPSLSTPSNTASCLSPAEFAMLCADPSLDAILTHALSIVFHVSAAAAAAPSIEPSPPTVPEYRAPTANVGVAPAAQAERGSAVKQPPARAANSSNPHKRKSDPAAKTRRLKRLVLFSQRPLT
jgi:hypothetical protein